MDNWNEVYKRNRKLDEIFEEKFGSIEPRIFEKNAIELIVEMCEFANESRFFKYWSNKESNKEEIMEEFADVIMQLFYFFNYLGIERIEKAHIKLSEDIIIAFKNLIKLSVEIIGNLNEKLIKDIFTSLLNVAELLNLNEEKLIEASFKKIIKQEERLASNY